MRSFNPLDDYLFSQYMASEGMENQLKSFINAVILEDNDSIKSINIANKMIVGEIKGKKAYILDLRSESPDGRHFFIIEVQNQNQYYFKRISLLCLAKKFSNSAKEGKLEELKPYILINILNYEFCKDDIYKVG
jgi:predicted transposase/invertase (TIGR01784 family)